MSCVWGCACVCVRVCVRACMRKGRGGNASCTAILQCIDIMLPCTLVVTPSGTGQGMMLLTGQV